MLCSRFKKINTFFLGGEETFEPFLLSIGRLLKVSAKSCLKQKANFGCELLLGVEAQSRALSASGVSIRFVKAARTFPQPLTHCNSH